MVLKLHMAVHVGSPAVQFSPVQGQLGAGGLLLDNLQPWKES